MDNNEEMELSFNEYQEKAHATAIYHDKKIPGIVYCGLKLTGEAGEVSEKIGKVYRDNDGVFSEDVKLELAKELGDVLWYLSNIAMEIGYPLEEIAVRNVIKLSDRLERGVIQGSGDNR